MSQHARTTHPERTRGRKGAAAMAAVAIIGFGTVSTLASWNDTEWVHGGINGDPGVGTGTFHVQQNTDPGLDPAKWGDESSNPGGALLFTTGSLALSPGDSVYAPVALRTTADSMAGTVTLAAAVAAEGIPTNDPDGLLWAAIDQAVVTSGSPLQCDATAFGQPLIASGDLGTAADSGGQELSAAGASAQYYCFRLTLPAGSAAELQGRTIAPAWQFSAVSDE